MGILDAVDVMGSNFMKMQKYETLTLSDATLKVPKSEIFSLAFFALSDPSGYVT
jgi:hypothetical protein